MVFVSPGSRARGPSFTALVWALILCISGMSRAAAAVEPAAERATRSLGRTAAPPALSLGYTAVLSASLESEAAEHRAPTRSSSEREPTEGGAPAQPSEGEEEPYELPVLEVLGERRLSGAEPAKDEATTFGTVIHTEEFAGERLGVGELLLQAPGTRVRRAPGGASLMLRGASPDQALVFLDGIRLNPSAGGGVDLRFLPAGLVEKITVLRGNEGARYGAGALGGVALLETKQPSGGRAEGALTLSGGSFGTYGVDASTWGGDSALSGIAAISLQRSEGSYPAPFDPTPGSNLDDVRVERLTNNDHRNGGLLLKGAARLGSVRLHAMTQSSIAERGLPGTLYWRDTQRRGERRVLAAVRAEPSSPSEHSAYGAVELRHDEVAVWGGSAQGTISQPATDTTGKPWQKEDALLLTVGVESAPVSWNHLRIEGQVGGEWLQGPYHGSPTRERLAATIVDELSLGPDITIAPALRYERIGAFDGVSPKLGVSVRPWEPLELRANAGRSFRVPSFGELYLEQGPLKPNPDLRPEHGFTVDAGAVVRRAGWLLQLSAFYSRTSDLISYEVVSGGVSKPFNFLDAEVVGGEAEAIARPLRWLILSTSYGYARTSNLRDDPRYFGNELPYRPAHRLLARIATRGEASEAFVEGSHQSAQFVNRANRGELEAQTSFRAGAGARLWTGSYDLWLSGQLENALDATLVDQLGFPQPGRALYFTLRVVPSGAGA